MGVLGIDHVQLAMPRGKEAAARSFYANVLGLDEVAKPAPLTQRGGCWFARADVKVHLGVDPDFMPATRAHVCFVVDDLAAMSGQLASAGYAVKADNAIAGVNRLFTTDPFGNRIEIMEGRAR